MPEERQVKDGSSWLVWVGGAALALVVLLIVAFLVVSRPPVSNAAVKWVLQSRGDGPAKVVGAYIGLGQTRIASATLGSDLRIEELRIDYGFPAIVLGKVDSVRARSIDIAGRYEEGGLELPLVGKLGGGKARRPSAELDLPSIDVDALRGSLAGLPVPFALAGRLGLAPVQDHVRSYRLTFSGSSSLGARLPTEFEAIFDGAGNATLKLNSGDSGPGTAARDALPAAAPGLLVNHVTAEAQITEGKLRSANAELDIRSGQLTDASFGAARLELVTDEASTVILDAGIEDIRLSAEAGSALTEKLKTLIAPWEARAPFGAFAADLEALSALPGGRAELRARLRVSQSAGGANPIWRAQVDSLDANIKARSARPLELGIVNASDGPARADLRLGNKPALGAHFGLKIAGPGPDIYAGAIDISSIAGAKGSPVEKIAALDIGDLKLDWPGEQVKLGLAAQGVHVMPSGRAALGLSGTIFSIDGALMEGISAKALRADLSGMLTKAQDAWIIEPNDDCFDVDFAELSINALHFRNGGLMACRAGAAPIVAFDTRASTTRASARIEGGPIFVDAGNKESRFDIAALTAAAEAELTSTSTSFRLTDIAGRVVDGTGALRFAPLDLSGAMGLHGNRLVGDIVTISLGERLLMAKLDHDLSTQAGSLGLSTGDLWFRRGDVDLPRLLPVLSGIVTSAAGKLRLDGLVSWAPGGRLSSDGAIAFTGFGVTTKLGRIEGIDGRVTLDRLWPPRTPEPQHLNIKTMQVGLPLADGTFTFNLPDELRLEIIKAVWPWAGGRLAIVDGAFVPGEKIQRVAMTADSVDLTEIFKLLSIDGLSGTGIVDGRLPIEVREGDAFIVGGFLKAREDGVLKYTGEAAAVAAAKGEGANLLFTALQNFNYQSLEIGVEGRVTGAVIVSLKLRGYNPDVYDGYPFEINIKIDSELANLITQTTQGLRIPEQIEKAVEKALPGAQ